MNKIILVAGYCATGKSTFACKLSQELSIPCFEKDIIKETLGDGFGSESGEVFKKGSYATFLLMLRIVEYFFKAKQVCILESNFNLGEIEQIKALLDKYSGECLLFNFKGDLDVLYDRYIKRHKSGERHWVHKSGGNRESFKIIMAEKFGLAGAEIGRTIDIDATSFSNINYDDLINAAREFIKVR